MDDVGETGEVGSATIRVKETVGSDDGAGPDSDAETPSPADDFVEEDNKTSDVLAPEAAVAEPAS